MLLVHRVADQCLVKSAGSTKHFLLRTGTAKETSSGMNTVGEIQGKRSQTSLYEAYDAPSVVSLVNCTLVSGNGIRSLLGSVKSGSMLRLAAQAA